MKVSEPPIIVEKTYPVSKEKVWAAITNLEEMKHWFFPNIPAFEAKVGFETSFMVSNEGRNFTHLWKVLEVNPNQKLKFSWQYKEWTGNSTVCFELQEKEGETTLSITCEVLEDFPNDIPEFKRESCVGGWEYFLGQSLKEYLTTRD